MNATLILPVLKQDQIWKDQTWDILTDTAVHLYVEARILADSYKYK